MPTCTDITYHIVFGTKNHWRGRGPPSPSDFPASHHRARQSGQRNQNGVIVLDQRTDVFPAFDYWQEGCGAFTLSADARPALIDYLKGQEEHHAREDYVQELQRMVRSVGLEWHSDHLP